MNEWKNQSLREIFNIGETTWANQGNVVGQYHWLHQDIWPSIQVIFKQTELVKIATEAIQKVEELGYKAEDVSRLIQFLNNKNRYELHELNIEDKTVTILDIRKVLSKRNRVLNLEEKCHNM